MPALPNRRTAWSRLSGVMLGFWVLIHPNAGNADDPPNRATTPDPVEKPVAPGTLATLQRRWSLTQIIFDGSFVDSDVLTILCSKRKTHPFCEFVIHEDVWSTGTPPNSETRRWFRIKVDASQTPMTIDLIRPNGRLRGICATDGKTLVLRLNTTPGSPGRPRSFDEAPGDRILDLRYEAIPAQGVAPGARPDLDAASEDSRLPEIPPATLAKLNASQLEKVSDIYSGAAKRALTFADLSFRQCLVIHADWRESSTALGWLESVESWADLDETGALKPILQAVREDFAARRTARLEKHKEEAARLDAIATTLGARLVELLLNESSQPID